MQEFSVWLLQIKSDDEDARRRGRNLVCLSLGITAMALIAACALLAMGDPAGHLRIVAPSIVICIGVLWLARSGQVSPGAVILIAATGAATVGAALVNGSLSVAPFYLILPVLIASLSLPPARIWLVAAVMVVGLGLSLLALPGNQFADPFAVQVVLGSVLCLGIVALVSYLSASSTSRALRVAQRSRADAEAAALALRNANADLEAQVAERTAALQARADEQAQLIAEIDQQRGLIRELSVPVIPVTMDTLVMPLVGALDSARIRELQEQALRSLEFSAARYLVLDITGVPVVDTQVAQGLLQVVRATRLLGAEGLLVGIRPEVAQAIVGLGLDLSDVYTAGDLQTALKHITLMSVRPLAQPSA